MQPIILPPLSPFVAHSPPKIDALMPSPNSQFGLVFAQQNMPRCFSPFARGFSPIQEDFPSSPSFPHNGFLICGKRDFLRSLSTTKGHLAVRLFIRRLSPKAAIRPSKMHQSKFLFVLVLFLSCLCLLANSFLFGAGGGGGGGGGGGSCCCCGGAAAAPQPASSCCGRRKRQILNALLDFDRRLYCCASTGRKRREAPRPQKAEGGTSSAALFYSTANRMGAGLFH